MQVTYKILNNKIELENRKNIAQNIENNKHEIRKQEYQ